MRSTLFFILFMASVSCSAASLRVMNYNVENLFDTVHDEGKIDWEFLPANTPGKSEYCATLSGSSAKRCHEADWTPGRLSVKLGQIEKVVDKAGRRPDLIGLVEIENRNVAQELATRLGYKGVSITESPDERGIDVALLYSESSALKFLGESSERVDVSSVGGRPSRDILVVRFEVGAKRERLAVLVNHWPSQNNKVITRRTFADRVAEVSRKLIAQGYHVLALGDFNVEMVGDQPSPFLAFENPAADSLLFDVDRILREDPKKYGDDVSNLPPGTYFYFNEGGKGDTPEMNWNMLDRFFVSKTLLAKTDFKSYRILNLPELTTSVNIRRGPQAGSVVTGVPLRASHRADRAQDAGFSDHFAVLVEFKLD